MIRVLMLGGGYATIDAYRSVMRGLGGAVRRGEVEITVVTPDPYHTFHGWTGEVLAGLLPLDHTLTPLRTVLPHAHLVLGRARRVDLSAQQVEVSSETGETLTLPYDHLLLGVGARDPFARFPGLTEHGHCLKDTRSMQRLHAWLETWQPDGGRAVVVGGGFAGVEMAAALRERFEASALQIELISATPGLLPVLRPQFRQLADHAERTLIRRQITVRRGVRVSAIEQGGVRLQGGQWLPADLVLVTAGMAPHATAAEGCSPTPFCACSAGPTRGRAVTPRTCCTLSPGPRVPPTRCGP